MLQSKSTSVKQRNESHFNASKLNEGSLLILISFPFCVPIEDRE
jgi:hypothetical protein